MHVLIAILYIVAVVLLFLVGAGILPSRAVPIAGACALLAYSLPTIAAGL